MPKSDRATRVDDQKQQSLKVVHALAQTYPTAICALHHDGPFQLLVATILSAQCTDERVNLVTPALFAKFPMPADLAVAKQADVEKLVQSTGFFRAKAANLIGMAQGLVAQFGGELPRTLDEMISLPGVGRKTANVVLGTAFGISTGVVVDTHVKRITRLLGLTSNKTPEKIERDLQALLPKSEWINFSHRLIHHGRRICNARRPKCEECSLLKFCARVGLPALEPSTESR